MCPADSFYKAILKAIFIPNKKKKCSHMYPYNIYICISLLLYPLIIHRTRVSMNVWVACKLLRVHICRCEALQKITS